MWSNTDGAVSVQPLGLLSSEIRHLSSRRYMQEPFSIQYVRLLCDTEILAVTSPYLPHEDPDPWRAEKLIKMSAQELGSWIKSLEGSVSRPAIGTAFIYVVQGPSALNDDDLVDDYNMKLRFMKLKHSDGSVVLDVDISPKKVERPGLGPIISDRALVFSSKDESCAVWADS